MNIWRIAGVALVAGLALFLVSVLVKLLLIALATVVLVRVIGGRLVSRSFGPRGRMGWSSTDDSIIAIDNPTYRSAMTNQVRYERVVPIS